jgi:methylmalonyl-CoA mutase cobalamin-binding subunit
MVRHLARTAGSDVVVAAGGSATPGVTALALGDTPGAILIAATGPGGLTEARYLCRRLRAQHPGATVVVGWWGRGKDPKKARALLLSAGADRVAATLREARTQLARLGLPPLPSADMTPQAV